MRKKKKVCDRLFLIKTHYTARPYLLPKRYLISLAGKISDMVPDAKTIGTTLADMYGFAFTQGYERRMSDGKRFKDAVKREMRKSWDAEITKIEDIIHPKVEQKQ